MAFIGRNGPSLPLAVFRQLRSVLSTLPSVSSPTEGFATSVAATRLLAAAQCTRQYASGSSPEPPTTSSAPAVPAAASPPQAPAAGNIDAHRTAAGAPSPAVGDDDEWTEVVHPSGQLYYWNQKTGETTNLGEPKPQSGGRSGDGGQGSGGSGGSEGAQSTHSSSHDPRAEAPLEDKTGTYAAGGIIIGALLGWVSQFF